jgi:hypothetical protein
MATRGSDKLREIWEQGGFEISEELLEQLRRATESFEVSEVYLKGTPRPDVLRATFDVDGDERCGNGVLSILQVLAGLGTGSYGKVVVFPKGTPVDKFVVSVELGE